MRGSQWGGLEGTLAVAVLKDSEMIFLRFDDVGAVTPHNGTGDRVLPVSPR